MIANDGYLVSEGDFSLLEKIVDEHWNDLIPNQQNNSTKKTRARHIRKTLSKQKQRDVRLAKQKLKNYT